MVWQTIGSALKHLLGVLFGLFYLALVSDVMSVATELHPRLCQVITTVILLLLTESTMWFLVRIKRKTRGG